MIGEDRLLKAINALRGLIDWQVKEKRNDPSKAVSPVSMKAARAAMLILEMAMLEDNAGLLTEESLEQIAKTIESLTGAALFASDDGAAN